MYICCILVSQDASIATSLPVIDLVDAIKPGAIKYDLVTTGSSLSEDVSLWLSCQGSKRD